MSEGRQKYSSSPLYGLKNARRAPGGGFQLPEKQRSRPRKQRDFVFLQLCLSVLLPLFFVAALILGYTELHWVFLGLSAVALLVMWLGGAFVRQARTTLTLVYIALVIVSFAAALWFTKPIRDDAATGQSGGGDDVLALFGRDVTSSQVDAFGATDNAVPAAAPASAAPDAKSEAQSRLELFMSCWMNLDYNGMLSYCQPAWVSAQANAQKSIFTLRGNRTPRSFQIESVSGDASDDSRTVSMTAVIDNNNGRDPANYRFEILMLKVNGVWYIAPESLGSNIEVKDDATTKPEYTLIPTATPDPGVTLYYNPSGGSYYHADENCSKVGAKYKPLKGTFTYSQVNDSQYSKLEPCSNCNAPSR